MEPLEFGKFIVQLITQFWDRCAFLTECNQGQAVIKKRFGRPIKWRTKPRWYWKWPLVDMFDKVDMRKQYVFLNAHSFYHNGTVNDTIVPYNILIDFQVEYQVVNPLVIYEASGYKEGEDISLSYVNNAVHCRLSKLIQNNQDDLSYNHILDFVKQIVQELHTETILQKNKDQYQLQKREMEGIDLKNYISINEIIITSFDKNISLRTTV